MVQQARWLFAVVLIFLLSTACTWLKRTAYEGFERDKWQQPARVIQSLAIKPGEHVVDLGAGGGYFTFRLADATGPTGKVYAQDVDAPMLDSLKNEIDEKGYKNVETILGGATEPKLPKGGADIIFLCNVYHHLENHAFYFKNLKTTLRPGGRIAIIDFQDGFHSTPRADIQQAMTQAGYTLNAKYDYLKKQNFQIFTPN